MNKKNNNLKIGVLVVVTVGVASIIGFLFQKETSKTTTDDTLVLSHSLLTYKENGSTSVYNVEDNKYLNTVKLGNQSDIDDEDYKNFFNIEPYNDKFIAAEPSSNSLVVLSNKNNTLTNEKQIKVNGVVENFRVRGDRVFIQYNNSNVVDIFDLTTDSLYKSLKFDEEICDIEVSDKSIYVGAGDSIQIVSTESFELDKENKIHIGGEAVSIIKATDDCLYIGNSFGHDLQNSILVKLDLKDKNVSNILELKKEYPVDIFERNEYVYVLCRGAVDDSLDGIVVVNKESMKKSRAISTGKTPISMSYTEDGYIYVAHKDGNVRAISAKDNFSIVKEFTINGIKEIVCLQD